MADGGKRCSDKEILDCAMRAGLESAVQQFPEDVVSAARGAFKAREAFSSPDDPGLEPWPPMRVNEG